MTRRIADLLTHQVSAGFVGRSSELASLYSVFAPDGPRVVHVSGIAGIGKSALLEVFAAQARQRGATVLQFDCRVIEPTESAFLHELCRNADLSLGAPDAVPDQLGRSGHLVVLTLDTYEVFRLLDGWLRQSFVPALPDNVRVLLFGRERPLPAWHTAPGWHRLFHSLALGPLGDDDGTALLHHFGVSENTARKIARSVHGHPLALQLAASVYQEHPTLALAEVPLQQALDDLTRMFLTDVGDAATRQVLEGSAVVRRVTVSLLNAMFPKLVAEEAYENLRHLPFVESSSDGLMLHDVVREAIARSLQARDPTAYAAYQCAAWGRLRAESAFASRADLWRYTADMLYLIKNPVVHEAFFPSGTQRLAVEPASGRDAATVKAIVERHEGGDAAACLLGWWHQLPQAFSVVRDRNGQAIGACCKFEHTAVEQSDLLQDPITAAWCRHLEAEPLPPGQTALFCRRWLSLEDGEAPGEVQAAVWLDIKRTYMEMRPGLRRMYLTLRDLVPYAAVAQNLGFKVLPAQQVALDGIAYHTAMLDFGPDSVDGWLAYLAAAELGIRAADALLDADARELVLGAQRVALTPLEFGVMSHLSQREGKAISRSELLQQVWGTRYEGGSNVVDAVIHTLRHKLGVRADCVETVSGVGYRLRNGR
jgi:hypothetical protein